MDNSPIIFNPSDLPSIISGQVQALSELGKKVQKCRNAAEKAKESADEALKHHVRWFGMVGKKEAIEYLQKSAIEMSKSQIESVEAIKAGFEYQQKMAALAQCLVNLGLLGIEQNKETVRVLESKLRFASLRGINKVAKQEIQQVIKELKSQRDLQCKVDEKIEQVSALQCKVNHTITQIQNEQNQTFWHSRYYNILIVILFIIGVALAIYSKLVSNGFG